MSYNTELQNNNQELRGILEDVNNLPEAGDSSSLDAFIVGSVTEVKSNAATIRQSIAYAVESITSIDFPNATSIGQRAFYGCTSLANVNIPKVTSIDPLAFGACFVLRSIALPSVKSIGQLAFSGCECVLFDFSGCTEVPVLNGSGTTLGLIDTIGGEIIVPVALYDEWIVATNWSVYADYIVTPVTFTEGLMYEYDPYENCAVVSAGSWEGAEELRIPLTQVIDGYGELPVSKIEYGGFSDMTMLKRVYADGITSTNGNAFYGCTNLEYLSIKGFKGFASFEFSSLSSLKEVILGDVEWVDWGTFGGCSPTCRFDFSECKQIPELYSEDSLGTLSEGAQIVVPAALYNEWKNTDDTNWVVYTDYIVSA